MKNLKYSAVAIALISTLAACGGSGDDSTVDPVDPSIDEAFSFSATEMITNLTDDVIVSGYSTLADKSEELLLVTQTLVNDKTQANLLAVQDAWKAAREPWEQGESHIFGPVDSLSIDPHLDSWPLNTVDLDDVLANNTGGFDAEIIKGWGDDIQGFHTMEYLIFGDGVENNEKDIADLTMTEAEYLMGLAEVFRDYTALLDDAWQVSYDGEADSRAYSEFIKNSGEDWNDVFTSEVGVIQELINGLILIVDEVGKGKIADPFGTSIETADTSLVESQYSWNSLIDFSDNIKGVRNIYLGEFTGASDKQGLIDFVEAADETLAARVESEIDEAIISIDAIAGDNDMPFRQAIGDAEGRVRIQTAVDALYTLQTSLEEDVLPLLYNWES
ncbi:MAG: imelysin family protein [Shewanella sp.]